MTIISDIIRPEIIRQLCDIAKGAGEILIKHYEVHRNDGGCDLQIKDDNSPVTEADLASNRYITEKLEELNKQLDHDIAIISEESAEGEHKQQQIEQAYQSGNYWCIDPMDGTKGFLRCSGEFAINIGLIINNKPVFGVIDVPIIDIIYYGYYDAENNTRKSWKQIGKSDPERIYCRSVTSEQELALKNQNKIQLSVLINRSKPNEVMQNFLDKYDIIDTVKSSSAIKFCLLAEGKAELYPRFGNTYEWDIAAGHAIILGAGGDLSSVSHDEASGKILYSEFLYGKERFYNDSFIAYSDPRMLL